MLFSLGWQLSWRPNPFSLDGRSNAGDNIAFISEKGRKMGNFPVGTKLYPALLFSIIGKPRWLFAFIGRILLGGLVNDRYERLWLERFVEPLIVYKIFPEVRG
jgi:hypothetical protein